MMLFFAWSSVNNYTRNFKNDEDEQWKKIKQQLKKIGSPDDNFTINSFIYEKL